jgi:arylsulfatase A-like enzyme
MDRFHHTDSNVLRDIIERMFRVFNNHRLIVGALLLLITLGACSRDKTPGPVILITIDTLRADHLGFSGYARNTSPFLDSLAEKGANFTKTLASSSHTAPSHASIFTGLQPSQHRVLANGQTLSNGYLTLAELFQSNGYETGAFTSVAFLRGLRKGFDSFDVPEKETSESKFRPAKHTISKAIQWLAQREQSKQLFLWVHLYDVHHSLPEFEEDVQHEYLKRVKEGIEERRWVRFLIRGMGHKKNIAQKKKLLNIIDRYDAQILNVDTEIHRLYDAVKSNKRLKNAMWVITSDHGEGLGNHNYLGHGERIYQEQLRVPLIFHFSDERYPPQKIQPLVRHVDLLPTVAELMKWKAKDQLFPLEGVSLAPLIRGEQLTGRKDYAFAQRRPPDDNWRSDWEKGEIYSLQTSRYKYIEHTEGEDEFYDLQTDPFELKNLSENSKEKEHLKKSLAEMYGKFSVQAKSIGDKPGTIEKEYLEELKALGYIN